MLNNEQEFFKVDTEACYLGLCWTEFQFQGLIEPYCWCVYPDFGSKFHVYDNNQSWETTPRFAVFSSLSPEGRLTTNPLQGEMRQRGTSRQTLLINNCCHRNVITARFKSCKNRTSILTFTSTEIHMETVVTGDGLILNEVPLCLSLSIR